MAFYKKIKALGTEVEFYFSNPTDLSAQDFKELKKIVSDFEKTFSRFKKDSELSRLNYSSKPFIVSSQMMTVLNLAKKYFKTTKGIFDPTIAKTLINLGYNQSFEKVVDGDLKKEKFLINFDLVKINKKKHLVSKDSLVDLDLGGIAKGFLVDYLVNHLASRGYSNFWLSAGGDMYLQGLNSDAAAFKIDLENPVDKQQTLALLTLNYPKLAVATSGVLTRKWFNGDKMVHHLIDPRTKKPAKNKILSVTALTDSVTRADIIAKTVLILGIKEGLLFAGRQKGVELIIVDNKLNIILSNKLKSCRVDII
jgi:thiamine biosynthesis lipoprotein